MIYTTAEFEDFYDSLPENVIEKFKYTFISFRQIKIYLQPM